jgi:hypothetical protein
MRMAQQERAIAHDVIDDLVAIEVPLQAPSGMRKVDRKGAGIAILMGDAPREEPFGLFIRPGGLCEHLAVSVV